MPNVGKSTLFNALTKNNVLAANYPFATIEPNTGIVPLPDSRLEKLGDIFKSAKVIPATVTFVDIAGIVSGAHKGEGMGNDFLSHIRETDAIAQVVRAFEDDDVQHVANRVDPQDDIDIINTELLLADIQTIDSHIPKLQRQAKADPKAKALIGLLGKLKEALEEGKLAINSGLDLEEVKYLNLLSAKPFIYVFNIGEGHITDTKMHAELKAIAPTENVVFTSAKIEAELGGLDESDRDDLMVSYGIVHSGLERLSRVGFETLGLQTFLTAGEKETKAWTIKKGSTAPQAAGTIHTDFERGFIAADIVNYDDLSAAGSWAKAREAGKMRTEGKDYVMRPDDVVEFKFNV